MSPCSNAACRMWQCLIRRQLQNSSTLQGPRPQVTQNSNMLAANQISQFIYSSMFSHSVCVRRCPLNILWFCQYAAHCRCVTSWLTSAPRNQRKSVGTPAIRSRKGLIWFFNCRDISAGEGPPNNIIPGPVSLGHCLERAYRQKQAGLQTFSINQCQCVKGAAAAAIWGTLRLKPSRKPTASRTASLSSFILQFNTCTADN